MTRKFLFRFRSKTLTSVATAGFIVAATLSSLQFTALNSQATSDHSAAVAAATASQQRAIGFAAAFRGLSDAQLNERMAAIAATGSTWVRFDLSWNAATVSGQSGYSWAEGDRLTTAARQHGLNVLMVVGLPPQTQQMSGCTAGERCQPASVAAYVAFVDAAAHHYAPLGVHAWEIWNEPNISYRFGPATNPAKYVAMLKGSYTAIKRVDAASTVLAGNTAPTSSSNGNLRPDDFIAAMYANGAQGYFDAIALHPYTYPALPSQYSQSDAWGQMLWIHNEMVKYGDGNKKIWITEFGAPTDGPDRADDEHVTEDAQAEIATEAITMFQSYSWSGPFFWYEFEDSGTATWTTENFYGIVRADGSHKPAYDAIVAAIRASQSSK